MNLVPKEDAKVGAGYGDVPLSVRDDASVHGRQRANRAVAGAVADDEPRPAEPITMTMTHIFMQQCVMLLVRSLVATL